MADLLYPSSGWTPPVTNWYTFFTAGSTDQRLQEKEREERRVAVKKAEALFLSCLTEKQREQFSKDKTFKVTGTAALVVK